MHPAQIKAALAVAGYPQVRLADELDVQKGTISAVINGRSRSERVEARIAEITGIAPAVLWPQWHGQPALVLSGMERELVLAFRAAGHAARNRALRALGASDGGDDPPTHVYANRGSMAAGRDLTLHEDPARYDRPKPRKR